MFSQRTQWQQQHPRSRSGVGQVGIRSIAQCLEFGAVAQQLSAAVGRETAIRLRQSRFVEVGKFVDPGDRDPPMRDVVGAACGELGDLPGDVVMGVGKSATRLDGLEMLPGVLGQFFGEVLDEPRPTGRVQHAPHVGLLQQQQLGIAGDPARKAGGRTRKATRNRDIEGMNQHGVRTADTRAEGGQGATQHVHPRVALGHHRQRSLPVQRRRPAIRVTGDLGDPGPQPARGSHLGQCHELVVIGGQPEADLCQRVADRETGFGEQPEIGHRRANGGREFPGRSRAQIVKRRPVDGDRPHASITGHPSRDREYIVNRGGGTPAQRRGQRIGAQIDRHRRALVGIQPSRQPQHRLAGRPVLGTGIHNHRRQVQIHTREQPFELVRRHAVVPHPDQQRADAVTQHAQQRLVGVHHGRIRLRYRLDDLPARVDVAQRVAAPDVGPLARQRWFRQLVEGTVERPDGDSVVGGSVQQPFGLIAEPGRIRPRGLGKNTGDRTAPTLANLF
ncbi:hypothetical protein MPS_4631 [Mycobacterium pseudoshottsii JCM 15466]|nr:hypothetical protein MPS_4631 [Mycobacterium pseudoshottsii JCM 15466]